MDRLIPAALAAILALGVPASAQGVFVSPNITDRDAASSGPPLRGGLRTLYNDLRFYGFGDIDVRRLSPGQIGAIQHYVNSDRPDGEIRNQIASIIRGGLGQRILDRVTR